MCLVFCARRRVPCAVCRFCCPRDGCSLVALRPLSLLPSLLPALASLSTLRSLPLSLTLPPSLPPRHDKAILVANQRRKWGVRWHTLTGKPDRTRRRGYPWDPSILVKDGEHVPNGNLVETVDHTAVADGNLAERVRGTTRARSRYRSRAPRTDTPLASPPARRPIGVRFDFLFFPLRPCASHA